MIHINHFSDILCIWAYISQIRMEELVAEFGDNVQLEHHLFPVFGDVPGKMQSQWSERGGIQGYSQHVQEIAKQFEHLNLHPDVWQVAQPVSSLPAHLHLCAVRHLESQQTLPRNSCDQLFKTLRHAFFVEVKDISQQAVLEDIINQCGLDYGSIDRVIKNGQAYAQLGKDMQLAKELNVRASPTLIFNDDRQRLTGNVGYKIIQANIKEVLERPSEGQSWC